MTSLFAPSGPLPLARIAVERGVDRYPDGLVYSVPPELASLAPGERVRVPLGRGDSPAAGYVIERIDPGAGTPGAAGLRDVPAADRIKPVLGRDAGGLSLPPTLMALARWISSYYICPMGLTLASMLPAAVKQQVGVVSRRMVDLAGADAGAEAGAIPPAGPENPGEPAPDPAAARALRRSPKPTPKQVAVLAHLRALEPAARPIEIHALAEAVGLGSLGPIEALARRGELSIERRASVDAQWQSEWKAQWTSLSVDPSIPPPLTDEQRAAVESILPGGSSGPGRPGGASLRPGAHLLFGVTGSGKTEVYLQLVARTLAAGRAAMLLVPEISLTPQSGGRVIARFPHHRVAILHSGLTAAQRHHQWALAASGKAQIVLGARSAVFAPLPPGMLGLIVVDEEHDASYKQDQAPRYHGRDVALRRGQLECCPVLLGSATPSLESWQNATSKGLFSLHRLTRRAPGLTVPTVRLVDFVQERRARAAERDKRVHLIGPTLESAIGRTLSEGGQVLLLLNRRGYGNYIACPDRACGWMLECDQCDATMVCHLDPRTSAGRYVRCHHCEAEKQLPARCPRCENRISVFGFGTQRVEEELQSKFPALRVGQTMARVDADTMSRSNELHRTLHAFGAGTLRLLLGTQMIAKGLDFPGVRLVGVVNADTAISLPDFRANERTFQLVAQVCGRCGRGSDAGLALVQTFQPTLPSIALAAAGDVEGFAALELEERRQCRLPPTSRMARIVLRHEDLASCVALAQGLVERLRALAGSMAAEVDGGFGASGAASGAAGGAAGGAANSGTDAGARLGEVRVRGPAPCSIARIANRHRQQVELFAQGPGPLQRLLAAARSEGTIRPGETMAVDVDPTSMA